MKIHRLDHIHVYCSDPDTSVRFYTGVLEAKTLGTGYGSDGGIRYFLHLGGLVLVLAPYPQGVEPVCRRCIETGSTSTDTASDTSVYTLTTWTRPSRSFASAAPRFSQSQGSLSVLALHTSGRQMG